MASKKRLLATAATGVAGELVGVDAVGGVAVRAHDVQWFNHGVELGAQARDSRV